ncbi:ArsR/SmtB family transcription factor [Leuconostoc gelidum]|uniref:ArsR/SmtB family transcription factor n=1 Tax=Leuconostoc gelidum TaxID=1244 RepID=UPI0002191F53|nr:ArsR family transcriptional regulator [Leuconostoc gelidum]AFS40457.1 ArsR family transcriptional regulator [Leuconostoc gelidum JB7]MBZ5978396.1 ArsR family transcriptional regulator [Leuconostoc gelidum subsp. gelidum]MBZ5992716.1 ArsR family transcriptional regulator [Leuconostoc gelidum subsp. gelidum]MBZ6013857.1 ArsR family transcriptional regulator [Leuconostoc gelidum subsp. gelidum]USP18105.1 ArsR family transcriptional regulator [Leuconostoc gelidum subsp. aenigmaticum]
MELDIEEKSLVVYKALASDVRLSIIRLLSKNKMSVQNIASALNLSSTIILMHLNKLAEAQIITFEKKGHNKIAKIKVDNINIHFPIEIYSELEHYDVEIPIGQYTDFSVKPTCGLAGKNNYIGKVDEPPYFMDPGRIDAGMIWWNEGFLEYQLPNYVEKNKKVEMIELSMELGSEFPFSNNVWLSDITFYVNNVKLGTWTSPGDFSDTRGIYTPRWVPDNVNQYGILKNIRLTSEGCYLDGKPLSNIKLSDIMNDEATVVFKVSIDEDSINNGGCTIFGKGFGNHDQGINMKLFYE